jgi:hypothetical protein
MTEYVMITSMNVMHWRRVCILVSTPPIILVSVPGEQSHLRYDGMNSLHLCNQCGGAGAESKFNCLPEPEP